MPYACAIKLCGLKTEADVKTAVDLGVEAVGFVLSKSPRRIEPEVCRDLRAMIPASIRVHGVFAAEEAGYIRRMMDECCLDVAQVHGREDDMAYWDELAGLPLIRAFRVKGEDTLRILSGLSLDEFLLDAYVPGKAGGTGETFDWSLALRAAQYGRVILAGGLDVANVGEAIRMARPYMVDVSGGIEKDKGVKDHVLMREFVEAARKSAGEMK